MKKGYNTYEYCPNCEEYTECYRDAEQEDLDVWAGILKGILTFGVSLFVEADRPYRYKFKCQECSHKFYTEEL